MHLSIVMSALGLVAGAAQGAALFGVAAFEPLGVQSLYRIDADTGAATIIGSTGVSGIIGVAWNAAESRLYAYTTGADVYTLRLNSGEARLKADAFGIIPEGDLAVDAAGAAFAVNAFDFGSVNLDTGAFTLIGDMGIAGNDVSGLAFDGAGALFGYAKNGSAEDTLVQIDTVTGAATLVGATGIGASLSVGALAFADAMFLSDGEALYTVDLATGAAALVGAHGVAGMSGMSIPAPGAAIVLAAAPFFTRRRR